MNTLMRLSLRNLRRNRRRTVLITAIVALATWAMMALWGISDGFTESMIRSQTTLDTGSLQLHPQGYLDDPDLANVFSPEQLDALSAQVRAWPQVRQVSARLIVDGLLQSAYGSQGVSLRGLDPNLEPQVTQLDQHVVEGRFLQGVGEVVMGKKLAEQLDVRLGERVVVQVQGVERPRSKGFRLVGISTTGLGLLDQMTAFILLSDAQALTEVQGASELAISLQPGADAERVDQALEQELGQAVEVSDFFDLNPIMAESLYMQNYENLLWMSLIALLAGFGVANTVTFTVLERMREFGIMLSLGLKPRQLKRLITLESLFLSGMGFIIGAVLGYGFNLYLERVGIDFGSYMGAFPDLGMPAVMYAKASWLPALYCLAIVLLTAVISARYPARRAAKLEPSEAMRYV